MKINLAPESDLIPYATSEELPPGPWVILSPHPDDETIGMGGTIAKAVSKGIEVFVVEITSGEKGGIPSIREREVKQALSVLGVPETNITFARFPEGKILEEPARFKSFLSKILNEKQPLTMFIPSPLEYHPDHRIVSLLTLEWIKENLREFKLYQQIAFYEITRISEANFLVCIDDVVKRKIKAIKLFFSQPDVNKYIKVSLGINKTRSYSVQNCKFVEAFYLNPIIEYSRIFSRLLEYWKLHDDSQILNLIDIKEKEYYIDELKSKLWNLQQEYKKEINNKLKEIYALKKQNIELLSKIEILNKENQFLKSQLTDIQNNIWWKAIKKFYKVRDILFPEGTLRRRCYNIVKKIVYLTLDKNKKEAFRYFKDKLILKIMKNSSKEFTVSFPCVPDILDLRKIEKIELDKTPFISVITVLYNNKQKELEEFVNSLINSSCPAEELIVVDNSDKEPAEEFFKGLNLPLKLKYIKTKNNIGFGSGVNKGAKHAKGEFILVVNPDTKLKSNTLELLAKVLHAYKDVGLVEPMQIPFEHPKFYNPVTLEPVWSSGCCFLVRKEVFERLKGFDENIFLYAEDVDFSWRVKGEGFKLKYIPTAKIYHDFTSERSSLHKYNPLSNLYLRLKYRKSFKNWLFLFLIKRSFSADVFRYFKLGLKARQNLNLNYKVFFDIVFFDPTSFGYEPFRRRGFDVPLLQISDYPKVSVIIRTHNRKELFRRAITSVANQTYKNIEVIVVEDRSNEALAVIRDFEKDLEINYMKIFEGRTRALNKGLELSTGKYIMFLDDDDILFCDAIELLVSYAEHKNYNFVYGGSLKFETDNKINGVLKYGYFDNFDRDRIMRENYIPMGSFIISKNLCKKVGFFDESLEYLEDWDFIRRAAKQDAFLFVPKDILIYCVPKSRKLFLERQCKLDEAYARVISKEV